jgi:hypothetical protein
MSTHDGSAPTMLLPAEPLPPHAGKWSPTPSSLLPRSPGAQPLPLLHAYVGHQEGAKLAARRRERAVKRHQARLA